jgi:protein-tyrosine kinase
MSERSEHLIERAAAMLRAANAAPLPGPSPLGSASQAEIAADMPPPASAPPASAPPAFAPPAFAPQNGAGPRSLAGGAPLPSFQPITLPPTLRDAREPRAAEPDRAAMPAPSLGDSIIENAPGPIPAPSAPLSRPLLSAVPPALTLPSSTPGTPAFDPGALNPGLPSGGQFATKGNGAANNAGLQAPAIVQLDALERAGMVVARTTRTRISEEYRIAIGRILRILHETTNVPAARNVLMVTSARPGEGKSFTALNLAGSIAQNGTDAVLLVDVDPKVKPLSDMLGLGETPGFLDLVSDPSLRPEDLLRVTAIPNLAVMPVGTRLGGAAQTIGGTASMRPIIPTITRLARRFPKHLIMLDAPPCLSTSDPHTLAPHVGQVVLVVEAERTQRSEVEAAVDLVRVCPSITLLLNKVRMTTSHTFGAYDYFGSYT